MHFPRFSVDVENYSFEVAGPSVGIERCAVRTRPFSWDDHRIAGANRRIAGSEYRSVCFTPLVGQARMNDSTRLIERSRVRVHVSSIPVENSSGCKQRRNDRCERSACARRRERRGE